MAGKNLIKNLYTIIYVRVPLETLPTNGKLKFDSKNNDSKSNYSKSSGNKQIIMIISKYSMTFCLISEIIHPR